MEKRKSHELQKRLQQNYKKLLKEFKEDIAYYNTDPFGEKLNFDKEIWVLRSIKYKMSFEKAIKQEYCFLELIDYCLLKADDLQDMLTIGDEDDINDFFYHKMTINQIIEELSAFEDNNTLVYENKYFLVDIYPDKQYPKLLKVSDFYNSNTTH